MNTISQAPFHAGIQALSASSAATESAGLLSPSQSEAASTTTLQSITGADGQSLVGIRDELAAAAQTAFDSFNGEGSLRFDVRDAIRSTLQENGFDLEAVESAMGPKNAGGGRPPRGQGPRAAGAEGEGFRDRFVQSFLGRFSEGTNLDVIS